MNDNDNDMNADSLNGKRRNGRGSKAALVALCTLCLVVACTWECNLIAESLWMPSSQLPTTMHNTDQHSRLRTLNEVPLQEVFLNISMPNLRCEYVYVDTESSIEKWYLDANGNRFGRYEDTPWSIQKLQNKLAEEQISGHAETITDLTEYNFDRFVNDNGDRVFVLFFAPWCKWSQKFLPVWERFAVEAKRQGLPLVLGRVNCTAQENLCEKQDIHSYPKLRMFHGGQAVLVDFQAPRTVDNLIGYTRFQMAADGELDEQDQDAVEPDGAGLKNVELLTVETFDDFLQKYDMAFFQFSTFDSSCVGCSHLTSLLDQFGDQAITDNLTVGVGMVDCRTSCLCESLGIHVYPTLLWSENGNYSYPGVEIPRSMDGLEEFARHRMKIRPFVGCHLSASVKPRRQPGGRSNLFTILGTTPWANMTYHLHQLSPSQQDNAVGRSDSFDYRVEFREGTNSSFPELQFLYTHDTHRFPMRRRRAPRGGHPSLGISLE